MTRHFVGCSRPFHAANSLNLETELRFHLTKDVHRWVAGVLDAVPAIENEKVARTLENSGFHLRITRDLAVAREYLKERFSDAPGARYGVLASSRDRDLPTFRAYNDFQSTKHVKNGPWYGAPKDAEGSCTTLKECVTEFAAQGLELDGAILALGTDLHLTNGIWSIANSRGFKRGGPQPKDPIQLRKNAYRVLMTRGRSTTVLFVPQIEQLNEMPGYLLACGALEL